MNIAPLIPVDPETHFTPGDAIRHWGPQLGSPGFPPEVPRRPPHENPEWVPRNPQEVPTRMPTPVPDWSPSSGGVDPAAIDEEHFPPTKHDNPARPDGKHDLGDQPDERRGPPAQEAPGPADEGGDIEEPGSQNPTPVNVSPAATQIRLTPSGREMRPTSQEAYY